MPRWALNTSSTLEGSPKNGPSSKSSFKFVSTASMAAATTSARRSVVVLMGATYKFGKKIIFLQNQYHGKT